MSGYAVCVHGWCAVFRLLNRSLLGLGFGIIVFITGYAHYTPVHVQVVSIQVSCL